MTEATKRVLKQAFTRPLANPARLQVRRPFAFPAVQETKCPKLDPVAKQLLTKEAKDADTSLARLQAFMLDALAPMVDILEEAQKGSLTIDKAAEAARTAILLLGNASTQVAKERRKRVIKCMNRKVHPLADDEEIFIDAPPLLLGKLFESKMKAHLESLKCLSGSSESSQNFYRGRHQQPRGGGNFRGRGGGQRRFHPYHQNRPQQSWGRKGKESFRARNNKTDKETLYSA